MQILDNDHFGFEGTFSVRFILMFPLGLHAIGNVSGLPKALSVCRYFRRKKFPSTQKFNNEKSENGKGAPVQS